MSRFSHLSFLLAVAGPLSHGAAQELRLVEPGMENEEEPAWEELADDAKAAIAEREELRRLGKLGEPAVHPSRSLASHARSLASFSPRRIAPGGAGEAHVVLIFHRDAGVEAGAHFTVSCEPEQGPLHIGQFTVGDPKPGAVQLRFVGRPVWEDTATFTAPISVAAATAHGRYPVELRVEAELTSGVSGQAIGLRAMVVKATLEVGDPIPRPRAPFRPEARVERSSAVGSPLAAAPGPAPESGLPDGSADARYRTPESAPKVAGDEIRDAAQDPRPPQESEVPLDGVGDSRWVLLTGGAILIVILFLLVFARGRRERGM